MRERDAKPDSNELYRLLFSLAPTGVVLTDANGRILEFNEQAYAQLGYTRDEFARLSLSDLDADETPAEIRARIADLVARGHAEFEVRHRAKSGAIRHVVVRSRPIDTDSEKLFLAVWQDITERKDTEEALRRSEGVLRAFSDSIPDPVFLKDRDCRWLFANPAALAVTGRPAQLVLGRTDREIYDDAEVGEALLATDRRIMAAGAAEVVEERIPTPEGVRLFLATKVPYRDPDGRVIGIIGNARDITDRKRAELAHEERERYLQTILQTALDGFYVVDREGRILEVNDAYCAMSGYSRGELLQMRVADLEAIEDEQAVSAHIERITQLGSDRFETRHRRKDGRPFEVEASTTFVDHDGGQTVCFVRDVTSRKEAEERARHAQKMESVGRLAGGIAHDFNNLLTAVLGCADALRDDVDRGVLPSTVDIEDIRLAGIRARDLTRQLLAFSRQQVVSISPIDLNAVVQRTEKLLRRVLGEDIELIVRLDPALPAVRGDPGQVEQVIMNVAVNARDAMPHGGSLVIETRNAAVSGNGPNAGEQHVELIVSDSGSGMAPDVKARMFEPFFTTKPVGQGTGLGLATVYGIVKQGGGHIDVESEPGRGTTLTIRLPRCLDVPAGTTAQPGAVPRRNGSETLLVIEDDRLVRDVIVRALEAGGYRVRVAGSGTEALEMDPEDLERTKLVIADVVMPGLDGRTVADDLRRRHPGLRVLLVSGYSQDRIAHNGQLDRSVEFLPKPFSPASLLARVRAILDHGRGSRDVG